VDLEAKQRLKVLKEEAKIKAARKQLIETLNNLYGVDVSSMNFADCHVSKKLHAMVYQFIEEESIKVEGFDFDDNSIDEKLEELLSIYRPFEDTQVLIFPSTCPFDFSSCDHLYLSLPLAIISTIRDFRCNIIKLINNIQHDFILAEQNLKFGFVISIDEYLNIRIEYWGA